MKGKGNSMLALCLYDVRDCMGCKNPVFGSSATSGHSRDITSNFGSDLKLKQTQKRHNKHSDIKDYYPYRAFGGQNKIVYSMHFVILLILPRLYVTNHLTLIYVYDMSTNRAIPRPP